MTPALWRAATRFASPLIDLWLRRRRARGKEHPTRFRERLGHPGQARPPGPLAWIHAASVGEAVSVLPLLAALRRERPDLAVLLTSGTVTSARVLAGRLPEGALHQFVPVDRPDAIRRFLDHWRPDCALWVESELWPNLIAATATRGIPMALVNGRMSERSLRFWRRAPALIRPMLQAFRVVLAQSAADAERFGRLGAGDVGAPGNLKLAGEALPADAAELDRLRAAWTGRPCWLAASTHPGEEALIAAAHRHLAERFPTLLTVIAPRHPERGATLAAELGATGLAVARRGAGDTATRGTAIYLADTIGELGLFYRLCPVVVMGKSLVGHGGQNPLEPARLGCAVLVGPHMENFTDATALLIEAGAAVPVADADGLAAALAPLLADPALAASRGAAGCRTVAARGEAVLERVMAALRPLLPAPGPGARAESRAESRAGG